MHNNRHYVSTLFKFAVIVGLGSYTIVSFDPFHGAIVPKSTVSSKMYNRLHECTLLENQQGNINYIVLVSSHLDRM